MEEVYQDYLIRAGGAPDRNEGGWKPVVQINWKEDGRDRVKLWMEWHFTRGFPTYEEAEKEANTFAKKWIDVNRPNPVSTEAGGQFSDETSSSKEALKRRLFP